MMTDQQQPSVRQSEEFVQLRRGKKRPYTSLQDRYTQQEIEEAPPFGRRIMEEMNQQGMLKAHLSRYLDLHPQSLQGILTNPQWKIHCGQVFKIAEFLHLSPIELLLLLYQQDRAMEVLASALLDLFFRLEEGNQQVLFDVAQTLLAHQGHSALTEEQEQSASRIIVQPEHTRLPGAQGKPKPRRKERGEGESHREGE